MKPLEHPDHLAHLDGLRGAAALAFLFQHAMLQIWPVYQNRFAPPALAWLLYGHFAVDVFIVLSGYCLMLPVARHGSLGGGPLRFYFKRARRILPPFYLALFYLSSDSPLRRAFSWKPLVNLGVFAYSIYLIHFPLLQIAWQLAVRPFGLHDTAAFAALLATVPLILLACYLFFLVCERPFMTRRLKAASEPLVSHAPADLHRSFTAAATAAAKTTPPPAPR